MDVADQVAQVGTHMLDQTVLDPKLRAHLPVETRKLSEPDLRKLRKTVNEWAAQTAVKDYIRTVEPDGGMLKLATLLNSLEEHCLELENYWLSFSSISEQSVPRYVRLRDLFRWLELVGKKNVALEHQRADARSFADHACLIFVTLEFEIKHPESWEPRGINRTWADSQGFPDYSMFDDSNINDWLNEYRVTKMSPAESTDKIAEFSNSENALRFAREMDPAIGEANLKELAELFREHYNDFLEDRSDSICFETLKERGSVKRHERLRMLCDWLGNVANRSNKQTHLITPNSNWIFAQEPAQEPAQFSPPRKIPPESRSRPITKKRAARLMGQKGDESAAVEWLSRCIDDGIFKVEKFNRQSFVFDINDFPKSAHPQLKATDGS